MSTAPNKCPYCGSPRKDTGVTVILYKCGVRWSRTEGIRASEDQCLLNLNKRIQDLEDLLGKNDIDSASKAVSFAAPLMMEPI